MTTLTDQLKTAPLPAPPTNAPFTHGYFDGVKGRPYYAEGYSVADAWQYLEGFSWGSHIRAHDLTRGRHRAPGDDLLARVRAVFQYAPTSTASQGSTAEAQTSQLAVAPPEATLGAAKSAPAPAGGIPWASALAILGWFRTRLGKS